MPHTLKVNTTLDIPDQFLLDIMTTAIEGGIGYWCCITKSERCYTGEWLWFEGVDVEDAETTFKCDLPMVAKALETIVNISACSPSLRTSILGFDACDIDADIADEIIQIAIFNEIVYQ